MVKDKRSRGWPAMFFFFHRSNAGPFEEGKHVVFGEGKKIMPVSRLPETCHNPHPDQVSPETDCLVHISRGHGQMIYSVKRYHDASSPLISDALSVPQDPGYFINNLVNDSCLLT